MPIPPFLTDRSDRRGGHQRADCGREAIKEASTLTATLCRVSGYSGSSESVTGVVCVARSIRSYRENGKVKNETRARSRDPARLCRCQKRRDAKERPVHSRCRESAWVSLPSIWRPPNGRSWTATRIGSRACSSEHINDVQGGDAAAIRPLLRCGKPSGRAAQFRGVSASRRWRRE